MHYDELDRRDGHEMACDPRLATILMAIGLLTAGAAIRRSGHWTPRNSLTPLALGGWMIAMIPLQFTAALIVAVGFYAVAVIALGVTLDNVISHGH